jgi:hypothetical protein
VTITEKAPTERMSEFEQRRKLGFGEFMTRGRDRSAEFGVPNRVVSKVHVGERVAEPHGPITQWFALSRREGGNPTLGACPMQVYLDRVPLPNPFNLDLLPSPKEITGIEVYAGQRRFRLSSTDSIEVAASFSSGRATEGDHVNANERTFRRRRDPITLLL